MSFLRRPGTELYIEYIRLPFAYDTIIQFKVLHGLHWSEVRLPKFKPSIDPVCDRCRILPANLSHLFWSRFETRSFLAVNVSNFVKCSATTHWTVCHSCHIWNNPTRYSLYPPGKKHHSLYISYSKMINTQMKGYTSPYLLRYGFMTFYKREDVLKNLETTPTLYWKIKCH